MQSLHDRWSAARRQAWGVLAWGVLAVFHTQRGRLPAAPGLAHSRASVTLAVLLLGRLIGHSNSNTPACISHSPCSFFCSQSLVALPPSLRRLRHGRR